VTLRSWLQKYAYADEPLPIGEGQTISQPYIVALMTETLHISKDSRVLEIGTGSGYQAAVLAEIAGEVYSIEIIESLAARAEETLKRLGYGNVHVKAGDGYRGWPEEAPFDAIIVTAAPDHVPQPLVEQLKVGGRMSIPVGDIYQELMVITKTESGVVKKDALPVRFVPMTGEAQEK
jgi:protein-L-isoaspartate(D-aspartate) O-methyltransferase